MRSPGFLENLKSRFNSGETKTQAMPTTTATVPVTIQATSPDVESGPKTVDEENEERVTKAVQKIIMKEVAEGDARVVYVRKAPQPEEGRCYTLVCCLVIILTLLIVIMVIKMMKGV
ncbi:uncharacterized protein LOC100900423 [Galendromus occidentalis]|uniref:Uncharacterized protein LOC100900423 n=1 Tax=Galendromus occidentalis TaxID=34638 RepID=A0AAJ6QXA2_9ACAR|nr:uncharacterized protein LOC100900423 [Galendromus occidentalis]